MYGAILGDIVGHPFETYNALGRVDQISFKSTEFQLLTHENTWSDDTVLAVAVADVILHQRPYIQTLQEWGLKYPKAGYGGSFYHWIREPSPYNSWSNGSAMRVPAIGWAFEGDRLLLEATRSAEISHNHPEGVKGAQIVAWAIYLARSGMDAEAMRRDLSNRFDYDLYRSIDMIRPHHSFNCTCRGSVPEAIICALEATTVEEAIRLAVSLGGDADTQACIAGAIAEARFGLPPNLRAEVLQRLPEDMAEIVLAFESKYMR